MTTDQIILALACAAIAMLVLLVTRWKMNPFIALTLAALAVGGGAVVLGVRPAGNANAWTMAGVFTSFQGGMGRTLGGIAGVIALGTILGKLLAESGGAEVLAKGFNGFFGPRRVGWCIAALAIAVGLSTWFAVGMVILLPILVTLTRETGRPFLMLAIPMFSFLSVMHGVMPPHPGPVVAIANLHASTGGVLMWGFLIGIPTAAIAGPFFARFAVRRVEASPPELRSGAAREGLRPPTFGITLFSILLPVALMLCGTTVDLLHAKETAFGRVGLFIGNPLAALLISVLFATWSLGTRTGATAPQLLRFSEESIASIGMTLLVVGGGGGFASVLSDSGVARILGGLAADAHLSPLLYGWLVSAFIRVATGSATVSITVASELLVPIVAAHPDVNVELLIVAIGCGSLFLSHLNDGGFWIVRDCLGLTVGQTLRTWTITETIVGLAGLTITLGVHAIWHALQH